jgi:hypothetical protein
MGFSIGERVLTKNDPTLGSGRTGKVVGGDTESVRVLAVFDVLFDGEHMPRRVTGSYLELERPAIFEAIIADHRVTVRQEDAGDRWMVSFYGMPHSCGPNYFDTKVEAMAQADPLTHFYLTKESTCTCEQSPTWHEVEESAGDRQARLLL